MAERVFVYGTLMRGQVNHGFMKTARFLGTHRTDPVFTMVALRGYPGVVPGGNSAVAGEVYQLDRATLARLDRLEDVPREYTREAIRTPFGEAWIYLYRGRAGRVLPSGRWLGGKATLKRRTG